MNSEKKFNIILDIDNTLLSSVEIENPLRVRGDKSDKVHTMPDNYKIYERPYLQDFLDYLFNNFNVSIWTAASKPYAMFVIKNIINKKGRNLDLVMWSDHCEISKRIYGQTKDLRYIWNTLKVPGYNSHNTLLFDDLEDNVNHQKCNVLHVDNFDIEQAKDRDDYLSKLILVLKQEKDKLQRNNGTCPILHICQ